MKFSCWARWYNYTKRLRDRLREPGVYLLAHFHRVPKGVANPRSRRVIYIGESCASLRQRLGQFGRDVFKNRDEHSGAKTYKKKFKTRKRHLLCVAVLSVKKGRRKDDLCHSYIKFTEAKLLYEFVKTHGEKPECNK